MLCVIMIYWIMYNVDCNFIIALEFDSKAHRFMILNLASLGKQRCGLMKEKDGTGGKEKTCY